MPDPYEIGFPLAGLDFSLGDLLDSFYGRGGGLTRGQLVDRRRVSAQKHELNYYRYPRKRRSRPIHISDANQILRSMKIRVPGTATTYYTTTRMISLRAWREVPRMNEFRRALERARRARSYVLLGR